MKSEELGTLFVNNALNIPMLSPSGSFRLLSIVSVSVPVTIALSAIFERREASDIPNGDEQLVYGNDQYTPNVSPYAPYSGYYGSYRDKQNNYNPYPHYADQYYAGGKTHFRDYANAQEFNGVRTHFKKYDANHRKKRFQRSFSGFHKTSHLRNNRANYQTNGINFGLSGSISDDQASVYSQLESMLTMTGINGADCLKYVICRLSRRKEKSDGSKTRKSLVADIMSALLIPKADQKMTQYLDAVKPPDCQESFPSCPMSLLMVINSLVQ